MSNGQITHDHELVINSVTKKLDLVKDGTGSPMYQVVEDIPPYQAQLRFTQSDWLGGHGQYDFRQPDMYFEGQSIDTTQEGRVFLGPLINQVGILGGSLGATPVCFCWFNAISKLMVATATKVFWYDGTNFVEKFDGSAIGTITNMVDINDVLYVCFGSSVKYYYSTDGANYTQTDLTDGYAQQIFPAPNPAGTATILWKLKKPNELSNSTDGRTVADGGVQWSTPAYIGDTSNDITQIFLVNDNLMVGKEDNLFHYDSDGGLHPMLNDLRHNRSSTNFKYVTEWQSMVYFSLITGLGEILYPAFETAGALKDAQDINKAGICVGLTSDKDWLYQAIDEGTNTIIYKGKEIAGGNTLRWEWCPWVFLGTNACATIKVCQHTSIDRRLWFAYGNYAGYVILTDNPTADSAARFAPSGWLRMSYVYGTDPNWDKLWQSAVIETEGGASGKTVQIKCRKDTETSATECIAAHTTNGVHEVNFNSALSCKRIQFEIHLASDTNTATPAVLLFQAKGVEKPTTVRIHEVMYSVGDKPSQRVETIQTFLRGGRTSTSLIKFADLRFGQSTSGANYVWTIIQPGFPKEVSIKHEKGRTPELAIQVRLQEVSYTIS